MVTPGARKAMIVVMILTPPRIVPNPCKPNPNTHRSPPIPGECAAFDTGVYPDQPNDAAPGGVRNPDMAISEPNRKNQYDNALSRGRATSGAPTCRRTITLAKPINNGVANISNIIVPCMVNSWLTCYLICIICKPGKNN